MYSIDYLSTVSGGGYIGSTLTYLEAKRIEAYPNDTVRGCASVTQAIDRKNHGRGGLLGSRFIGAKHADGTLNGFLNHIRGHGNYLTQGNNLGLFSFVAMVLRSILLGVLIWIPIATLVLILLWMIPQSLHGSLPEALRLAGGPGQTTSETPTVAPTAATETPAVSPEAAPAKLEGGAETNAAEPVLKKLLSDKKPTSDSEWTLGSAWFLTDWLLVAILILIIMAVLAVITSHKINARWVDRNYGFRVWFQQFLGILLKGALILMVIGSLPFSVETLHLWANTTTTTSIIAFITSLLGGITAFQGLFASRGRIKLMGPLAIVGAGLMLYGVLMLSLLLANALYPTHLAHWLRWEWGLFLVLLVVAFTLIRSADLNLIALHRLYRDRLMETFMPNDNKCEIGLWHRATDAERLALADVCAPSSTGPYQLLNTNLILTRSDTTSYAGRGGDSFTLSPLYCGSNATGWRHTQHWMRLAGRDSASDRLSLATAMAISGAALNPNAGSGGRGPTRQRFVSIIMGLLNLRLGFWALNPSHAHQGSRQGAPDLSTPEPTWMSILPGLLWGPPKREHVMDSARPSSELYTWRGIHSEFARFIELSDGGHFENLGIYELVRRRVKIIIAADAGCDPKFSFADLGNAIERCRVDFGVDIEFIDQDWDLRHLLPLPSDEPLSQVFPLATRGVALARILYPPRSSNTNGEGQQELPPHPSKPNDEPEHGYLVYLKTTLTHRLPADLYAYKRAHPRFPDQTTGDQWFDEAQFEAYRELGYGLLKQLLSELVPSGESTQKIPIQYAGLCDWLKRHTCAQGAPH